MPRLIISCHRPNYCMQKNLTWILYKIYFCCSLLVGLVNKYTFTQFMLLQAILMRFLFIWIHFIAFGFADFLSFSLCFFFCTQVSRLQTCCQLYWASTVCLFADTHAKVQMKLDCKMVFNKCVDKEKNTIACATQTLECITTNWWIRLILGITNK